MQPKESSGEGVVKLRSWAEFKQLAERLRAQELKQMLRELREKYGYR